MNHKRVFLLCAQIFLLCAGAVCLGLGISRGEPAQVLQKAILVCLECIGLG
jgi:hypothetical protein